MKRLISIELQKLWKNKASRVLTLSYFILLTFIALVASINFKFLGFNIRLADQGIFNFPYIWHFNTWTAAWAKLFLAIVIVSMISNEYSYGTLKQNLIDGMSKKEFLLSKFLTVVLISLVSTIFIFALSMILGLCFSSYTEAGIIFTDLDYLLGYFVKLVGFFSFCLFLAILIKRSAFALGFLFIWFIFEGICEHLILPRVFGSDAIAEKIVNFFPIEAMANLIKEPISRFQAYKAIENQLTTNSIPKDYTMHWCDILIVLMWITIFMFLSYKLLKKRDL
ncbi:MAG TPA: ABC transporter permease subunit [Flavobacterium sp.]|nr:ABC transporter permease subunit [Flavobacterium sp.]